MSDLGRAFVGKEVARALEEAQARVCDSGGALGLFHGEEGVSVAPPDEHRRRDVFQRGGNRRVQLCQSRERAREDGCDGSSLAAVADVDSGVGWRTPMGAPKS